MNINYTGATTRRTTFPGFGEGTNRDPASHLARQTFLPTLELRRLVAAMVD